VLTALVRKLPACTATTAFVPADIGQILAATTDSASDGGVIVDYEKALETIGGVGDILVAMSDANDDYSTAGDTLTSASTGVATQGVASFLTAQRSYGIYVVRFSTTRRYVRFNGTVSTGGSWGYLKVFLNERAEDVDQKL
jgi:hypothetical protein